MTEPDRDDIIASQLRRRQAREQLRHSGQSAADILHPKSIWNRFRNRQVDRLADISAKGKRKVHDKRGLIATAAIGSLLFWARRPIWDTIEKLRQKEDIGDEQAD